jgi:hypothetical protein
LEVILSANDSFSPDELHTHLKFFEEKIKQADDYTQEPKTIVSPAQLNVKHYNPPTFRSSNNNFIQNINHETSKDIMILSKMFHDMLMFKSKFNKEREKRDKKVIYFRCHKEYNTIHSYFLLFSHLKSSDGNTRQDKKDKYINDGFKGKHKSKTMNIIWEVDSDDDNNDSDNEVSQSQELNFALMIMIEDILS